MTARDDLARDDLTRDQRCGRAMTLAWLMVAIIFAADFIWLPFTHLAFTPSENLWKGILAACIIVIYPVIQMIARRTRNAQHPMGIATYLVAVRFSLFVQAFSFFAALSFSFLTFTYLAAAAAFPLRDANLAAIDHMLGFDWLGFLSLVNAMPHVASIMIIAYQSSILQLFAMLLILSATNRADRLSEVCAILALVSLTGAVINIFVPANGAFLFYAPTPEMSSNIGSGSGSGHAHLFGALREHATSLINFDSAKGLITFPSIHTAWAIITWWAVRDVRIIGLPALLWNGIVILSTMPEGGHYFIDVAAGTVITIGAIAFVRSLHSGRGLAEAQRLREALRDRQVLGA